MHGNELGTVRGKKDELNVNFAFKELDWLRGEISPTQLTLCQVEGNRTPREHQRKSWGAWKREKKQPFKPGGWLKKKIRSSIYYLMMSDLSCKLQICIYGCFLTMCQAFQTKYVSNRSHHSWPPPFSRHTPTSF